MLEGGCFACSVWYYLNVSAQRALLRKSRRSRRTAGFAFLHSARATCGGFTFLGAMVRLKAVGSSAEGGGTHI